LNLSDDEVEDYRELLTGLLDSYETVRERGRPVDSERNVAGTIVEAGSRVRDDDPYNAWITHCKVVGRENGELEGWDVGVKDNIAVAGIEMTCGSQVMEGYVPQQNATVVDRLLKEGARVVGKTNMDDMAFTGNGHSSAFGPTLNPHNESHLSGGSSGGSAIAVATEEVDVALGGDQGGSIRAPAAWTGVVGHKPTHGLTPYTGCVGIENTIDHVGPLAPDVETAARTLSVIAGVDGKDPRQPASVPTERYEAALDGDVSELSIGVVLEGFDRPDYDEAVNQRVWEGIDTLESLGATVEEISIPIHDDAMDIYTVALAEGFVAAVSGEGLGHNWKGWYDVALAETFGKFRRAQGGDFPPSVKLTLLAGAYTSRQYHSKYYAEAMNLREELTNTYDDSLQEFDVLAMPTTPQTANEWVPEQDRFEFIDDAWGNLANTCAFNMTGHPSLSVPVEPADGLPVGLMLTGRMFDDVTVLNAGYALQAET
ncbi:MAG: amidase, partial [Halodesulfurarchaeum sp.]